MIDYNKISKASWNVIEKDSITNLEVLGLERALEQLVESYENFTFGEVYNKNINELSFICDNSLFINNPYKMDNFYIQYICCDENSIMLAYVTEEKNRDDGYYIRLD